jgi:cyclopropane fatty-acyl-phospholipid synthase-like methyltransferase
MPPTKDDRGYNQVWADSASTRIRAERRCDHMISKMDANPSKSLLEIGCGTGENCFMLAQKTGMTVLGTDLCRPFIDDAKKRFRMPNLSYDVLDFNKAEEFQGKKFDYIIGNGILHHLYRDLDGAFATIKRLLNEGGKIIFFEPNIYNPYVHLIFSFPSLRAKAHLEPDEMAFSRSFVVEKLTRAGYKNIEVEFKDFLLPGIPEALVKPSIFLGDVLEKLPLLKYASQSLCIAACAQNNIK